MNPFTTAFIKAPKRSRFSFNHSNTVGIRFGALTPTMMQFIVPNDDVSMSVEQIARLAPMPVPTFVDMKVRHDFFFVPLRLLYGSEYMDKLFGSETSSRSRASTISLQGIFNIFSSTYIGSDSTSTGTTFQTSDPFVPGTLFDYLGYPVLSDRNSGLSSSALQDLSQGDYQRFADDVNTAAIRTALSGTGRVLVEPLFAYHFIWRDWYRFTGIESNTIVEPYISNGILSQWNSAIATDYTRSSSASVNSVSALIPYLNEVNTGPLLFGSLGKLKLAHFSKDMFTSARYGSKPTVLIPTGTGGTIPALREASAIQRYLDIISITGQRYFDKVKGLFGVTPEGPKDDRVQFLARYQQYIKVGEVLTTATTSEAQTGDYSGRGVLIDGKYLFKRHFTEHGWLFCITSVIPNIAYSGLSRQLTDVYPIDTPLPSLAEVGDQSILLREVGFSYSSGTNQASFGDQFRYYAYKSAPNEVHGYFSMLDARPWSPLLPQVSVSNPVTTTKVNPFYWNFVFNDTGDEYIFGDRFFFNIDFYCMITRSLPKYINYHL